MRTLFCTLIMSLVSVFAFAQTEPDFEMEPHCRLYLCNTIAL